MKKVAVTELLKRTHATSQFCLLFSREIRYNFRFRFRMVKLQNGCKSAIRVVSGNLGYEVNLSNPLVALMMPKTDTHAVVMSSSQRKKIGDESAASGNIVASNFPPRTL